MNAHPLVQIVSEGFNWSSDAAIIRLGRRPPLPGGAPRDCSAKCDMLINCASKSLGSIWLFRPYQTVSIRLAQFKRGERRYFIRMNVNALEFDFCQWTRVLSPRISWFPVVTRDILHRLACNLNFRRLACLQKVILLEWFIVQSRPTVTKSRTCSISACHFLPELNESN
jgi:hypothetical protein